MDRVQIGQQILDTEVKIKQYLHYDPEFSEFLSNWRTVLFKRLITHQIKTFDRESPWQ